MKAEIVIRTERAGDAPVIRDIVQRAYADVPYSDRREYLMIDRLRETDAFLPQLSLVAEVNGTPAGHILLTKAQIRGMQSSVATLALAPLSVVPEHQGSGVGSHLVLAAHDQATLLGFESIVLVGIPGFYPRFGYVPLSSYPIELPFEAPDDNCMILPLMPQALVGVAGLVEYVAGWVDH